MNNWCTYLFKLVLWGYFFGYIFKWNCQVILLVFLRNLHIVVHSLHQFTFPSTFRRALFSHPCPNLGICVLSDGRDSQFLLYLMKQSGYSSDIAFWSEDSYFYLHPNNSLKLYLFYFNHSNDPLFPNWRKRKVESKTRSLGHSLNCNLKILVLVELL